jgi:thiol-disulfide isomerase/thioredoxin
MDGRPNKQRAGIVKLRTILLLGVVLFSLAVLFSGCVRPPSGPGEPVGVGDPAPAFSLPDMSGRQFTLDQFRGKVVLLDFWATWCGPCRMTMPMLERMEKEFQGRLVLLAINMQEDEEVIREYMQEQAIRSRVLLDKEGAVGESYGLVSLPTHVLIDREGIVRFIRMGFSPGMESQFRTEIQKLL